jgi:hypothetical protein
MKKLLALLTSLLILTPAFALAEGPGPSSNLRIRAEAQLHASTTNSGRPAPGIGQSIKKEIENAHGDIRKIASSTREDIQRIASTTRDIVRGKIDAIRAIIEKHKEDTDKKAGEARDKARARFGEHIEKLVGTISDRLASTSTRFISLADRADARIQALQGQGHAMTQSVALLATTRTDIQLAQTKILAVNTALAVTVSTTTPKSGIPAVRAAVKAAEQALEAVKKDLLKTLQSIKVEGGADAEATTTVQSN